MEGLFAQPHGQFPQHSAKLLVLRRRVEAEAVEKVLVDDGQPLYSLYHKKTIADLLSYYTKIYLPHPPATQSATPISH